MTEQDQSGANEQSPEPEEPPDNSWAVTEQVRKDIHGTEEK
ncbi:MAG: hypothetical protein QOE45_3354 [Frankiaceae bacterium]|jgi:hypothetical protein|nr:hypothetical protein [Frankiaceae bacterium]